MNIHDILTEINSSNSSNFKMEVLKKYKDNTLLQKILKMTYDKVQYVYGITSKNVDFRERTIESTFEEGLDLLDAFNDRLLTGNNALFQLNNILSRLSREDGLLLLKILDRDLKINMGTSNINKVFKNLITKSVYMRCNIGTKENITKHINFPAFAQLKSDGTYRETSITDEVSFISRSSEPYEYNIFKDDFKDSKKGYIHGEMTIICNDKILEDLLPKLRKIDNKKGTNSADTLITNYEAKKSLGEEYILPRSLGNGLLNSSNVPHEQIVYEVWDYVTPEDYKLASNLKSLKKQLIDEVKLLPKKEQASQKLENKKIIELNTPKTTYKERFKDLQEIISKINNPMIRVIEHVEVNNISEAYEFASSKMKDDLEGAILKDFDMIYEDGTSNKQLKLKIKFELDVRITGFIEGKKGTKRESTFGSMTFSTDDGHIKGSVSGFNDVELEDFNSRREELIGKVIEIEGNDLTKASNNNYYAVSHPRFTVIRNDKDYTDTLERAMLMLESAKTLK